MGKFQLGQPKPEGSGRKKGVPNKATVHLHEALSAIQLNPVNHLAALLPRLSAEKQADVMLSFLTFLYPKRKAIDQEIVIDPPLSRVDKLTPEERKREIIEMTKALAELGDEE